MNNTDPLIAITPAAEMERLHVENAALRRILQRFVSEVANLTGAIGYPKEYRDDALDALFADARKLGVQP